MRLSKRAEDLRIPVLKLLQGNRRSFNRAREVFMAKRAAIFGVLYRRMRRGSAAERAEEPVIRRVELPEKLTRLRRLSRLRRFHTPGVNVAVRELLFEERTRRSLARQLRGVEELVKKPLDVEVLLKEGIKLKEGEVDFLGSLERAVNRYVLEPRRERWLDRVARLRRVVEKRLKALRELEVPPVAAMREVTVYLNYIPQMAINRMKTAGISVPLDRRTGRGRGATAEFEYKVFRWVEEDRVAEYKADTIDLWFDVFFWFEDFRAWLEEDLDPLYGITNRSDDEVEAKKVEDVKGWCAAAKIRTANRDVVWRGCGPIDQVRYGRKVTIKKLKPEEEEEIKVLKGYDVMTVGKCTNYHQGVPV